MGIPSKTFQTEMQCGKLYVTVTEANSLSAKLGKPGGCVYALLESISRLASLAFEKGASEAEVKETLAGISCDRPNMRAKSCADAIARVL